MLAMHDIVPGQQILANNMIHSIVQSSSRKNAVNSVIFEGVNYLFLIVSGSVTRFLPHNPENLLKKEKKSA